MGASSKAGYTCTECRRIVRGDEEVPAREMIVIVKGKEKARNAAGPGGHGHSCMAKTSQQEEILKRLRHVCFHLPTVIERVCTDCVGFTERHYTEMPK
jgi:hypothetical protein